MSIDKTITKEEIREMTGKCRYCNIKDVQWFCPDCWFGVCDDCVDPGETWGDKCPDCLEEANTPLLADIELF